ncbi:MAG: hypothetical protein WCG47_29425 [Dermatophilaceae bacterium]
MEIEDLRLAVYDRFRRAGTPTVASLASELSTAPELVRAGLAALAQARHLALGPDGEITMAHPFTAAQECCALASSSR